MVIAPPIIGTAGWAIPREDRGAFGDGASVLERYATRFGGVEVNSSFYRPHRRTTWERWRDSVPPAFRFAVKLPKVISHEQRLVDTESSLARFVDEVGGLGDKLGVLLLQLPPTLRFDAAIAGKFLALLTTATTAPIACEPRHPSWFDASADALLYRFRIARVAADPAITASAATPGGWPGLTYRRLHGSPAIYRSRYDNARLAALAHDLRDDRTTASTHWCIFDNTAAGAATGDAMRLMTMFACTASDTHGHRRGLERVKGIEPSS